MPGSSILEGVLLQIGSLDLISGLLYKFSPHSISLNAGLFPLMPLFAFLGGEGGCQVPPADETNQGKVTCRQR